MSLSEVEQYQQREQQYEQARSDYERREAAYRAAATANPNDPGLGAQHDELLRRKKDLDQLYAELTTLRNSLAHATEVGPRQAKL